MPADPTLSTRTSWKEWANFLRSHRLEGLAIWLMEGLGPLALIGAQIAYAGSPFFTRQGGKPGLQAIASMLEDQEESLEFIHYLRESGIDP